MHFSADYLQPDTVYLFVVEGEYETCTAEAGVRFFRTAPTFPEPTITQGAWPHAAQYLRVDLAEEHGGVCQLEIQREYFDSWQPARIYVECHGGVFKLDGAVPGETYRACASWFPPASQSPRPSAWLEFEIPFPPPPDWELLGIGPLEVDTISISQLQKCFKKQALKFHPDKGGDAETFKQLQDAFANLRAKIQARKASTGSAAAARQPCRPPQPERQSEYQGEKQEARSQKPCKIPTLRVARRGWTWLAFYVTDAPLGAVLCVAGDGPAVRGDVNNGLETFVSCLAKGTKYRAWIEVAGVALASVSTWTHGAAASDKETIEATTELTALPMGQKGKQKEKRRTWTRFDDEEKGYILGIDLAFDFSIDGDRLSATLPMGTELWAQYFDPAMNEWVTATTLRANGQSHALQVEIPMRYGLSSWRAILICTEAVEL